MTNVDEITRNIQTEERKNVGIFLWWISRWMTAIKWHYHFVVVGVLHIIWTRLAYLTRSMSSLQSIFSLCAMLIASACICVCDRNRKEKQISNKFFGIHTRTRIIWLDCRCVCVKVYIYIYVFVCVYLWLQTSAHKPFNIVSSSSVVI